MCDAVVKAISSCIIIGIGAALSLTCLILIVVTCTLCHRLKRLKQSQEGLYKRSKTCKHYRLSMRELQEQEDAWDEENGFTNFEPMTTIGSAFDSPHHGPTPPPPPRPPKEAIHTDCKTEGTDGLKQLSRSKEKSYKTSKTSKRFKLSVREQHYERKEAWNGDDSITSSEPMMTIGSAFGTPFHGPTPTSPPPPTDEFTHTGYCKEETDRPKDHGQTSKVAEPRFKKKVPLKPPQYKTLPSALERRCLEDLDDALNKTAAVAPSCHTLDYRLDQSNRQEHPSLTDTWYNEPNEWDIRPDDCRPYYMGKLSDQNIRKDEDIYGNDVLDVNEILKNANAIEVIHDNTLTENMYENLITLREDKKTQNLNPAFRRSIGSYIDMTASPEGEEYVQMKITLTKSAASEICRKARLRGVSCTSEVLNAYIMDKPTNSSVD